MYEMLTVTIFLPALVTLEDVLSAVTAHTGVGRDRRTASWALKGLCRCGQVVVEVRILDHEVGGHDGQRELQLEFRLAGSQHTLLSLVPDCGPAMKKGG